MLSQHLQDTIGDPLWIKKNETQLKCIFPETWTHMGNIKPMELMYKTKLAGIPWSSEQELSVILAFLTKIGIVQVQNMLIRRNPETFLPVLDSVSS